MKYTVVFAVGAALVRATTAVAAGAPVWGFADVRDGDTLMVGSTKVRLFGIDAPELNQSCARGSGHWNCGTAAAEQLTKLVGGKRVFCASMGVDQYQRVLGRCVAGTSDVNQAMVSLGYAVAYRRYSTDYVSAEESAKARKLGLWAGSFQMPEQYRHATTIPHKGRSARSSATKSSETWAGRARGNCNIKGNRNRKGEWIYHLPGMPYYEQTRPEDIFCTEAEAQAAGYRRAIVR